MKYIIDLVKRMIIGGIIFFVPLIIFIVIIEKAIVLARLLVRPIVKFLAVRNLFGFAAEVVIALAVILLILFVAGLFSKTSIAKNMVYKIEDKLLSRIPMYVQIKHLSSNVLKLENNNSLKTVLVEAEGGKRIAFLVNKSDGNKSVIFIPDAPNPWSGALVFIEDNQLEYVDVPAADAMKTLSSLGENSDQILKRIS